MLFLCSSLFFSGNIDIKIPMSKGLAGYVASSGTRINIKDCYADGRFDQSVDKKSGFRTRSMLCLPIFSSTHMDPSASRSASDVIGVLQVINKNDEERVFDDMDERMLRTLLELSGPILAASSFFTKQKTAGRKEMPAAHTSVVAIATEAAASNTGVTNVVGGGGALASPKRTTSFGMKAVQE